MKNFKGDLRIDILTALQCLLINVCGIGRTLERCGHLSPDIVVNQLIADAQDWAGGTLRDDAVAIIIERAPVSD